MNIKEIISSVLSLCACATLMGATEIVDGIEWYYSIDNGAVILGIDRNVAGKVTIPSTLGGCSVVGIDYWAFKDCYNIEMFEIPASVKRIDDSAFYGCKIACFEVAATNKHYASDEAGFLYDKARTKLIRASGGGAGYSLYSSMLSFSEFALPETLEVIGEKAFFGYAPILNANIKIPASVTNIEAGAFSDCSKLYVSVDSANKFYQSNDNRTAILSKDGTTLVHFFGAGAYAIPNSVTNIAAYACSWCRGLTSVVIPDSVTGMGQHAFGGCESLTEFVMPMNVEQPNRPCAQCYGLRRVMMPEGSKLKRLYDGCFQYCTNLIEIVLAEGLEEIIGCVFWNCTSLSNITLPESLVYLGYNSFQECTSLTNIYFRGNVADGLNSWSGGSFYRVSPKLCGCYRPKYRSEWQAVIDGDGRWRGIRMYEKAMTNVVRFALGEHGTRVGGGELQQVVLDEEAAVAPIVRTDKGWRFVGWNADFSCVASNILATALYEGVRDIDDGSGGKSGDENAASYVGVYDGKAHGIGVVVTDPAEGATIRYATTKEGPYVDTLTFKDVCSHVPIWYEIAADGYNTMTNWATVTITPKTLTDAMCVADEDAAWFYDGTEKKPAVAVVDGDPNIATTNDFVLTYSGKTSAGKFPVTITGTNNYTGVVMKEFAILKRPVAPPVIPSSAYNGNARKPTVPMDSRWTVVSNPGGKDAGEYTNVVLRLTNTTDYKWKGYDEDGPDTWTGVFVIRKASNGWSVYPGMASWTYGETPSEPAGKARYGIVSVAYRKRGAAVETETSERPSEIGLYTARFWVAATQNYNGVSSREVDFEIIDSNAGEATTTTPVPVPHSWLDQYVAEFGGGDRETAGNATGKNGRPLWESYVAGLDPTDEKSQFTATITVGNDGVPSVTWSPDLSDGNPPRTYITVGRASLTDDDGWVPVTDANKSQMKFFKVQVEIVE